MRRLAFMKWVMIFLICSFLLGFEKKGNTNLKNPTKPSSCAADSMLDPTFGNCGKVITNGFGFGTDSWNAVTIQKDGKIVVAGGTGHFALARYNIDGSLDTTFGMGGLVTTDFGDNDAGEGVTIQSDGRIVVVGASAGDFALARYNPDGTLDSSFGKDGKVTTDFGGSDDQGNAVAIQSDGKIVVAGKASNGTNIDFALARYNPDGDLDTSFGMGGLVTTDFRSDHDYGHAIAIQSDGKIIVAGFAFMGGPTLDDFALARYNPDGTLDSSFGKDGKVTTDFGGSDGQGNALAIQSDGKIIVAGFAFMGGTPYDFALVRYNSNGTLDSSFGKDGKVTTDLGGYDEGHAIAIQFDGKIVVAGYAGMGANRDFVLARYNPDGTLDSSFGKDGKVTTDFGGVDTGRAMAIQSDGKIVVAGDCRGNFALARFNSKATLDKTFATKSQVKIDFAENDKDYEVDDEDGVPDSKRDRGRVTTYWVGNDVWHAVAIQSNGKILVAGESGEDFALARYNPEGGFDTSFGKGSKVTTNFSFNKVSKDYGNAVVIQSDGKIAVAGGSNGDFALARYNTDGSLDTTFGKEGKVKTNVGDVSERRVIAIQSDGKIVVAGGGHGNFVLVRYNTDGSLDPSFGNGGRIKTDLASSDKPLAIANQKDGKIIVAGEGTLVRYNPNGTLDTNFGKEGKVQTGFWGEGEEGEAVAIQKDGKIVVVRVPGYLAYGRYNHDGSLDTIVKKKDDEIDYGEDDDVDDMNPIHFHNEAYFGQAIAIQSDGKIVVVSRYYDDFVLARYNTDGILDISFSEDGKVKIDLGGYDVGEAVAIQNDGKIVMAGYTMPVENRSADFALVRYNSNGTLDTTFGKEGKVKTDFGRLDDQGYAIAVQHDGKIVVVGESSDDFALARYNPDGTLDTSFGKGGRVQTDFGGYDKGLAVAIQKNGKILVAGEGAKDFALARYSANGSLDTSFGKGGKVQTDFGGDDKGLAVAIQKNGKILVAGEGAKDFALARYNANGSLDTSFGKGGKVQTDFGGDDKGLAVAVQKDGKILVAGEGAKDFALARYNTNGTLDTSFGKEGRVTTNFKRVSVGRAMAIQKDGKILVVGGSGGDFALARYNSDGSVDTSFGMEGEVKTDFGRDDEGRAVAVQKDGKIVVAGGSGGDFALARYNTNGTLDITFGKGGKVKTGFGGVDIGLAVAIQKDGKIVVAGRGGSGKDFALARYNANGTLDTSFGKGGKVQSGF